MGLVLEEERMILAPGEMYVASEEGLIISERSRTDRLGRWQVVQQ